MSETRAVDAAEPGTRSATVDRELPVAPEALRAHRSRRRYQGRTGRYWRSVNAEASVEDPRVSVCQAEGDSAAPCHWSPWRGDGAWADRGTANWRQAWWARWALWGQREQSEAAAPSSHEWSAPYSYCWTNWTLDALVRRSTLYSVRIPITCQASTTGW